MEPMAIAVFVGNRGDRIHLAPVLDDDVYVSCN